MTNRGYLEASYGVGYDLFLDLSGGHVGVLALQKIIWLNLSVNIILQ